ncbi:MAG: FAD-dependent oxidoreductase [Rhizobiaceae bacterium]
MIVIVGGGIVGLSLGFRLLSLGAEITVLEENCIGGGASWAAAGYLEPTLAETPAAKLEWLSLDMWPGFVDEIVKMSGQDVDYQTRGQLKIAYKENEAAIMGELTERKRLGWQFEVFSGEKLRELEPSLSKEIVSAIHLPQVSWVDGRKLCGALAIAIKNLGGVIKENTCVKRVIIEKDRAVGVETLDGKVYADNFVLASGCQTDGIGGLPVDLPKSYGQKGIILTLQAPKSSRILHHLIKRPDGVICPRNDGRILIGVTRQDDNLSPDAEPDLVAKLLQSGIRAMPQLADLPLIETIVGFRPFVRETNVSVIGESASTQNFYYSLGHGSDGYLRAPYLSSKLAEQILDKA